MDADWTNLRRIAVAAAAVVLALLAAPVAGAAERALVDRPDDHATPNQVHVIYAVPSDGADNALDTNGTLATSVGIWQQWLKGETGGPGLTLDTAGGELDITFARLPRTDADLADEGLFIRDEIETALRGMGLLAPRKLYAVYYDGSANEVCGGAPWPQSEAQVASTGQQVGAFYLHGQFANPGIPDCDSSSFATAGQPPGYKEFAALHELIHGLGVAPTCAPHHTLSGHVSDSPTDLMYAGASPWNPTTLDVGGDDYFNADVPGCLDLADSKYLEGKGDPPSSAPGPGDPDPSDPGAPTDPTEPSGDDRTPPETTKGRGPKRKIDSRKATFRFSSPTADSFECRLDKGDWKECDSPAKAKKLNDGKHKFFVRGINAAGVADETPVVWKFKVET